MYIKILLVFNIDIMSDFFIFPNEIIYDNKNNSQININWTVIEMDKNFDPPFKSYVDTQTSKISQRNNSSHSIMFSN